jgi:GTP-binding protein
MDIRNIAIIAHVDHGKTRITDALMHQTGMTRADVSMDSNALEQERGITIYSKNTSVTYKGTKINIVDTPGHVDFGSEVERVLRSIDSVVLVVDAQEGPMPQTKFVLKKSLELGLAPIVVINKIDKPAARIPEVEEMIYELFFDLGANDDQLGFVTLYTNAKEGIAKKDLEEESEDLTPLLDAILERVRPASSEDASSKPFRIQPFNLAYDNYIGRLAICRVYEGTVRQADSVVIKDYQGGSRNGKITRLFTFEGLERKEVPEAYAGDIIMIAGLPDIYIGETICASEEVEALPGISIDEPTISLKFLVNNSPFAGREGKYVTNRQLKERLEKELEVNVGLKVDFDTTDHYKVYGRGELHIAILLENMRREGFELQVSQPTVLFKEEKGRKTEPYEELTVFVPEDMSGMMIEKMAKRKGQLMEIEADNGEARIVFEIPVRGLLGYRNEFLTDTRGEGIMYTHGIGYKPYAGEIEKSQLGSMVSMMTGKALGFSLFNLQKRGTLYIGANTEVYEGSVIGNTSKGRDMTVNPVKGKQLTNMRAAGSDDAIRLTPPTEITLERGLGIMNNDEYLEVTPRSIRLRKILLTQSERGKAVSL